MCSRAEVLGENDSARNIQVHWHAIDFDLLPWHPLPAPASSSVSFG